MISAVLWDFGGVITSSPFESFNRYEREHGLPENFIRSVNATNPDHNAWARLESSEIDIATFDTLFAGESETAGHRVPGADVLLLLSGHIRPRMVEALKSIKQKYRIACITNNVRAVGAGPGMMADEEKASQVLDVMGLFDFVIESSVVGFRKPDPRIYTLACDKLEVDPAEAVFLDDLGINLKPARALGMSTIKVVSEDQALKELSSLLGMDLTS